LRSFGGSATRFALEVSGPRDEEAWEGDMKFLIDTNIFIPLEPTSETDLEAGSEAAFAFVRRAREEARTEDAVGRPRATPRSC